MLKFIHCKKKTQVHKSQRPNFLFICLQSERVNVSQTLGNFCVLTWLKLSSMEPLSLVSSFLKISEEENEAVKMVRYISSLAYVANFLNAHVTSQVAWEGSCDLMSAPAADVQDVTVSVSCSAFCFSFPLKSISVFYKWNNQNNQQQTWRAEVVLL